MTPRVNLASLNLLTFFDAESGKLDVELFLHATRIWTVILDISCRCTVPE